jgi:amino acid adenylation domain-containing protein
MSARPQRSEARDRLDGLSPTQRALLERALIKRRAADARRRPVSRREVESPVPLSHAQELLWLLSQVFDDGIAYNAPGAFRLEGPLDIELLRAALQALAQRHEILRTTYRVIDGRPMQVISDSVPVDVRLVDISGLPGEDQDAEVQRILTEESGFAFDLENGPMMRPTVIRVNEQTHVFMLVLHHIATDGWSRGVIYRDLTGLYDSLARGLESPLTPLSIQYADYAVWHRDWLEGGVADEQIAYWKGKLAGAPSRLDLPTDHSRPRIRSYRGDHISLLIDQATRERLRTVAREGDATLFVALLAAFTALLRRYSGQEDIVVGTPFAGRSRSEFEPMVGYFINPLPLRVDLSGDPTFAELVRRARETTLEAFAKADVPYESVVRATNPQRDLSQTPVFQAMMVLHNPEWQTDRPKFEPVGLRATELTYSKGWAKFDVLLGMSERPTGLNTTWEYSTELFRRGTVRRMMDHFRVLAESAASSPDRPISRLTMLTDAERAQVLVRWNRPSAALPRSDSIKELFESQAARQPEATAVVLGSDRLSYGELNRRANQIAWQLRGQGVGPGTLVGVVMAKSPALLAAVLGVAKAGGAYVPLDPFYPADRLEFMIADSSPAVLLTDEVPAAPVPHGGVPAMPVSWASLEGVRDDDPDTVASGDDLAYVIYTSGSTGRPKGVMIRNRSLAGAYFAYERAYGLSELRSHLQMASFSFDVFTGDMIRSLLAGAKLVLAPLPVVVDPAELYEVMVREEVDAAEFVPATASMLFEYAERTGRRLDFMRLVVVSSEAWRNEKYVAFKRLCGPETRLLNSYGLTEATIDSTWFEAPPDAALAPERFVSIGRALDNTRVYVLDPHLEPTPIGVPGELCIGGEPVAQGYLGRPELTEERFPLDPFSEQAQARLYRTGDLVRWLPDGNLEYLGRTDRQLKIRGFRIEPGEIEAVLERFPDVRGAAVVDRKDPRGETRLVAYFEASEPAPRPSDLRTFIAESVPNYMVPSQYVMLSELPLTPNGKVDRDALPDPEWDRTEVTDELVAPRTATEHQIAEIWSRTLGLERPPGVTESFFDLGGHSLMAVQLFAEIEGALGVRVPLATLFAGATIEHLASEVQRQREDADGVSPSLVQLRPGSNGTPPLFLCPWVNGEILGYRNLVSHLEGDHPVYGLQPQGLDGKAQPHTRIEEMAAHYVREVRAVRPAGPYRLGGYCFGGTVAYEMAHQLEQAGETVDFLALLDASPYGHNPDPGFVDKQRAYAQRFREGDLSQKRALIAERAHNLHVKVRRRIWITGHAVYRRTGVALRPRFRDVRYANRWAMEFYVAGRASCRVTLFRADAASPRAAAVWEQLTEGRLDIVQVPTPGARHDALMEEPHATVLGTELSARLAQLEAERNAGRG